MDGWQVRTSIPGEDPGQPYRLAAQLRADQVLAAVDAVALVEEQVEDVEHALQPRGDLVTLRDLDGNVLLANLALGAHETLSDGGRFGQEGRRDLLDAEAADGLERQGDAAEARQGGVAAHEHHGQLVVADGPVIGRVQIHDGARLALDDFELAPQGGFATEEIERAVLGDLKQPRARFSGHAAIGPRVERADEGILHRLLREVQPRRAEAARERGHHASRAVAEQVLDERVDLGGRRGVHRVVQPLALMSSISRTSRLPAARWGWLARSRWICS